MRLSTIVIVLAVLILAIGSIAGSGESELVPIEHRSLRTMDGTVLGEILTLHVVGAGSDEPAELVVLETSDGLRARLSFRLDDETGISVRRFEDLSSGWDAEWRLDGGMTNLGDPADYADPWQWFEEVEHRRRQERHPVGHAVSTSDGFLIEWEEPFGATREDEPQARRQAVVELAAGFYEQPPPESAFQQLRLLSRLIAQRRPGDLSISTGYLDLVETLLEAAQAAKSDGREAEDDRVGAIEVDRVPPGKGRDDLLEAARSGHASALDSVPAPNDQDPPTGK